MSTWQLWPVILLLKPLWMYGHINRYNFIYGNVIGNSDTIIHVSNIALWIHFL